MLLLKYGTRGGENVYTTDKWIIDNYVPCHSSNYATENGRDIDTIVVHYTGNDKDTALANCKYFKGSNREASAHFFVDDNEVIQSVEIKNRAWHAGSRTYNQKAIGIEMCTSGGGIVSEETKNRTISLIADLYIRYDIRNICRHYDVTGKLCPYQMSGKNNKEWNKFVADVGTAVVDKKALARESLQEAQMEEEEVVIKYVTKADVPAWALEAVEYCIKNKIIADENALNLSEEGLRLLVFMYRLHIS